MLECAGFEIIDLGTDVSPEKFIASIKESEAELVDMSALLTTTIPAIKTTIDTTEKAGLREKVKLMIGGAPGTQKYAAEVGADIYAPDGAEAARKAKTVILG